MYSDIKKIYDCKVGYSGHETSLLKVCIAAVALGATSIERHITLDRTMHGSDQAASIEVSALERFVESVRMVPLIKGDGIKKIKKNKKKIMKNLNLNVSLKKFGNPKSIADICLFLASEKSHFVTGSVWIVDGGQVKQLHY